MVELCTELFFVLHFWILTNIVVRFCN